MQILKYVFAVLFIRCKQGSGNLSVREADYQIAILDIESKATTDFDAAKSVRDFIKKYDNSAIADDTNKLIDSFISNRNEAASLLIS